MNKAVKLVINIWNRIKHIFKREKYFEVENFKWSNFDLTFHQLTDEVVLNLTTYLKDNLKSIKPKRKNGNGHFSTKEIDELIHEIKKIVHRDSNEHIDEKDYTFKYFVDNKFKNSESIKLCNVLSGKDEGLGNVIYKVLEIYMNENNYILINNNEE